MCGFSVWLCGLTLAEPFEVFGANLGCVLKNYMNFLNIYKYGYERGIAVLLSMDSCNNLLEYCVYGRTWEQ